MKANRLNKALEEEVGHINNVETHEGEPEFMKEEKESEIDVNNITFDKYNPDSFDGLVYVTELDGKKICFYQGGEDFSSVILDIIGTSHCSSKSRDLVDEKFEQNDYNKCMVELDKNREEQLRKEKMSLLDIFTLPVTLLKEDLSIVNIGICLVYCLIGIPLLLFIKLVGSTYRILLKIRGRESAGEFKEAIKKCDKEETDLVNIDKDISKVISDYREEVSNKKFLWVVLQFIKSKFFVIFGRNSSTKEMLEEMVELEEKYPYLYTHFLEKRNLHMTGEILHNIEDEERVLIIMGAGHIEGVTNMLDEHDFREINVETVESVF